MSSMLKTLLSICIGLSAFNAQAITQENVPVVFVGSQSAGTNASILFIYLGSNNLNNCPFGGVYFTDEALRKDALVVALAAKALNRVVRLDFTGGAGTTCVGTGIFIQ
jgi:hypothetical protein